ncbi:Uncharacterized conserved protein, DUF885 familyt [Ekhidna lutea]|uniref:Uncharacterized conserved protein, DUF885 familyt n=2 Tax=Ekhidna lutea TaxID=447679 RepID=A0A239K0G3_EKHLU|nr:Uncharacterized conserved protein, DUF885 familyt [Ekhidna lutea]
MSQSRELLQIIQEIDSIEAVYEVDNSIWRGQHPEVFQFARHEQQIIKARALQRQLDDLKNLSIENLSEQEIINRSIKILQLQNIIDQVSYKTYLIPFNAEGGFFNSPSFFLPNLPFETKSDFQAYLDWLPSFSDYIAYNTQLLEFGLKEQIVPPKIIIENNIQLLEPWISQEPTSNPFFRPMDKMNLKFGSGYRKIYQQKLLNIIKKEIVPAYKKLESFLIEEYLPSAPDNVGISEIKNGKAYYESRIRFFTTMEITPDSVYKTGLSEVKRIRKLMDQVIADLNFEGTFQEFLHFLRNDPQFYPKTEQELLNKAAWLSKKAEGQLPRLFSKLYELPFTVEPVPDDIAPKYTGGRYVGGSKEQGKAGIYWVNTYNLPSRTLYTLPALTLHEAVPGHHLQITLASELEGLPDYRKNYYISAFGEGWGLYAEYLGEEMGMYETPYDLFGRYTYEMWRACRLVVDVGLHYKGWTREQAVNYMASNTALSLHEVNTEIDRYIGWPGQAVSYKMGELTIKNLRQKASQSLGDQFDIKEFHHVILKNGSVPLPILISQVDAYISSAKSK